MPRYLPSLTVLFLALFALWPAQAQERDDVPRVTRAFAIENTQVVPVPGQRLEGVTVIVEDGLITAVGADVSIPFDAQRIAGDSLVVYAGFIDGFSHAGIPRPEPDTDRQRPEDPGNPPNDAAGIQPDRDARLMLDPSEKSLADLREAGFTVTHTVPRGRMLPGRGALIFTAGDSPSALTLQGSASMPIQFAGGQGVYPSTPMAMMAKLRQMMREADRRQRMETLYASNPTGLTRPPSDVEHLALFPVNSGELPVVFRVEGPLEAHRALRLQEEMGFTLIMADLEDAMDATDALRERGVPVFLSLDLPEDKLKDDSTGTYNPDFRTASYADTEAEAMNLKARQKQALERRYAHAAQLDAAGVPMAFMTEGAKVGDIHENLRTMVAHGLSEESALAALTTTPASLLGLSSQMGTVETGKIANLVVTTAPYFDEDAKIKYVFVDGALYEMEVRERRAAAADGAAVNPVGTWSYEIDTPQGTYSGTLTFTGSRDDLSGTITSSANPEPSTLQDVEIDGNDVSFSFDTGGMGVASVAMTLFADEVEGSLSLGGLGSFPLTGTRTSGPDRR